MLAAGGLCGEGRFHTLRLGHFQRPVNLICGDMIESLPLIIAIPHGLGRLEEGEGAHYVRLGEGERILDAAVHMALSCQMDDAIHFLLPHKGEHGFEIADIRLHETVIGFLLYVLEIRQVTRIGKFIYIDNPVLGILVDEKPYYVTANETGAAGNDYSSMCHFLLKNAKSFKNKKKSAHYKSLTLIMRGADVEGMVKLMLCPASISTQGCQTRVRPALLWGGSADESRASG